MSQEINILNDQHEELLEIMGYYVGADCTNPGKWVWTSAYDPCNPSYETKELALAGAWNDLTGQIKAADDILDSEWNLLSFEKQKQLIMEFDD